MIPQSALDQWAQQRQWSNQAHIEQDLLLEAVLHSAAPRGRLTVWTS